MKFIYFIIYIREFQFRMLTNYDNIFTHSGVLSHWSLRFNSASPFSTRFLKWNYSLLWPYNVRIWRSSSTDNRPNVPVQNVVYSKPRIAPNFPHAHPPRFPEPRGKDNYVSAMASLIVCKTNSNFQNLTYLPISTQSYNYFWRECNLFYWSLFIPAWSRHFSHSAIR